MSRIRSRNSDLRFCGAGAKRNINAAVTQHNNYKCTADFENAGDYFFFGQITLWAIARDILRGPRLF
jgi:hypothetical protein